MAGRKSGRKPTQTNRFGVDDGAQAMAGGSNTTNTGAVNKTGKQKNKGRADKRCKRVIYSSSSEHNTSSETVSSEDSRGDGTQPRGASNNRRRNKSYSHRRTYTSRCPTWDGDKDNFPHFAEQFRLFIRELNKSWDIYTTKFTEEEDTDIYNFLLRASNHPGKPPHKVCYQILFPQYQNKGQEGFKALERYCVGSRQARINNSLIRLVNYRLQPGMKVIDWAGEIYKIEAILREAGILPTPTEGQPSLVVVFHMQFMPAKYSNLMTTIRQRKDSPYPSLEEFVRLLLEEEESKASKDPFGHNNGAGRSSQRSEAPMVEEMAAFTSGNPQQRRPRPSQKRRRGHGGGGGGVVPPAQAAAAAAAHPRRAARDLPQQQGYGRGNGRGGGRGRPAGAANDYYHPAPQQSGRGRGGGGNRGRGFNRQPNYGSRNGAQSKYYKSNKWCYECCEDSHNTNRCWWSKSNQ